MSHVVIRSSARDSFSDNFDGGQWSGISFIQWSILSFCTLMTRLRWFMLRLRSSVCSNGYSAKFSITYLTYITFCGSCVVTVNSEQIFGRRFFRNGFWLLLIARNTWMSLAWRAAQLTEERLDLADCMRHCSNFQTHHLVSGLILKAEDIQVAPVSLWFEAFRSLLLRTMEYGTHFIMDDVIRPGITESAYAL